jgi:ubiquinone/menaquinone biosynthesis C-methylase UbiE
MKRKRAASSGLKTDWGQVAGWYDELVGDAGSEYHQQVVLPGTLRMLELRSGEKVVDIACGQGVLCRKLQSLGAQVTGIDAAAELIELAKERGPASIRYEMADARELSFLPANQFDAVACILAIQNIHPIQPVFTGVSRCLAMGGRMVIVLMHPCFRGPKETSWGWDQAKQVQYRRVDRYLLPRKVPIVTRPGAAPDVYTWTFHKPLEAYVKALASAGLFIDKMEEWPSHKTSQAGGRAAAENTARKEIPMFMAIRARKIQEFKTVS